MSNLYNLENASLKRQVDSYLPMLEPLFEYRKLTLIHGESKLLEYDLQPMPDEICQLLSNIEYVLDDLNNPHKGYSKEVMESLLESFGSIMSPA